MKLDVPKAFDKVIDYQLPTGETKKMKIDTKFYELILIEDAIQFKTTLEFNPFID